MFKELKQLGLVVAGVFVLALAIFLINQLATLSQLAGQLNSVFGTAVLIGGLVALLALILYPLYLWKKMPRALMPPSETEGSEYEAFLAEYRKRLAGNPHVREAGIDMGEALALESACTQLEVKALKLTQDSAAAVFLSTAISQNGRLDAFLVLMAQLRLVWKVSQLYNQRPSAKEMLWLYGNVAGATFLAGNLEDVDVGQQVAPIVSKVMGTVAGGAIPGLQVASTVLTNMIFEGTVNAFLTLRVGAITRLYCDPLHRYDRKGSRKQAWKEATLHLGSIVVTGSQKVSSVFWKASKDAAGGVINKAGTAVTDAGHSVKRVWHKITGKNESEMETPIE